MMARFGSPTAIFGDVVPVPQFIAGLDANLIDSLPLIVWTADARTFEFQYVSKGAERLLGYPAQRWIDEPTFWRDHLHSDDRDIALALCHSETQSCRDHELLYRMIAADGRIVWLRDKVQVRSDHGSAVELSGFMFDVTSEIESQRAREQSEENYRQLVEGVSDVIYTLDANGRITSLNRAFERASGATIDEWIGRSFVELLLPESAERAAEDFRLVLQGSPCVVCAYQMRAANGAVLEIETSGQQRVPGDPTQGTIGMARDVTERNSLARRVEESKRLESLGDLAATMAHEMNNVLMAIQPYCELLILKAGDDDAAVMARRRINTTLARGKRITSEILYYANPKEPAAALIDAGPWMADVTALIDPLLPNNVTLQVGSHLFEPIVGDQHYLEQILTNLVANAVQAMPNGGLLALELKEDSDSSRNQAGLPAAKRFARLTVRNSGPGIPAHILSQIFEPLFTTKRGGTGLGLAIVKRLLERQGGAITVESSETTGTAFHVFLPIGAAETKCAAIES